MLSICPFVDICHSQALMPGVTFSMLKLEPAMYDTVQVAS